jgi:hypothetical protein
MNRNADGGREWLEARLEAAEALQALRTQPVHPAWRAFMAYCRQLGHGEIERLGIQDGLPVLTEVTCHARQRSRNGRQG